MNAHFYKLIPILIPMLLVNLSADGQEWEMAKEENQVTAYSRVKEGGIKAVRVVTEVEAPLEKVIRFITDYDNPKEWKHSTRTSKIVKRESADAFKVYFVIATPWPLKDRDFYADVTVNHADTNESCEIIFIPDTNQENHGNKVRMTNFDTRWKLTDHKNGKIEVELYSFGDPVGVPISFVNMFIVDTPFKTVKNLKRDIKDYK